MTWDQYKVQKAEASFGAAVTVSEGALDSDEAVESVIKMLGDNVARGARLLGYDTTDEKRLFVRPASVLGDPLNQHGSIGGKVRAKLNATPEKYIAYAQEKMKELVGALEDRSDWLGFLRWRLRADSIEDIEAGRESRFDRFGEELHLMARAIQKLQAEEREEHG